MAIIARRHGISVDKQGADIKVTFGNKVIASGEYYEKEGTFMMDVKGKSQKFKNAGEIINYLTKHKIVEYKMTNEEKDALALFSELMKETLAQATVKGNGPDTKTNDKDNKVNDKTKSDIAKNKEAPDNAAGDTLSPTKTSKKDSESFDSEDKDSKKTRTEIEKNDKTKSVKYPGKNESKKTFGDLVRESLSWKSVDEDTLEEIVLESVPEKISKDDIKDISDNEYKTIYNLFVKKMKEIVSKGANKEQAKQSVKKLFDDLYKEYPDVATAFLWKYHNSKK